MQHVLQAERNEANVARSESSSTFQIAVAYVVYKFLRRESLLQCDLVGYVKNNNRVETLSGLLHNSPAFTSPVDEVVAWGEDTWP